MSEQKSDLPPGQQFQLTERAQRKRQKKAENITTRGKFDSERGGWIETIAQYGPAITRQEWSFTREGGLSRIFFERYIQEESVLGLSPTEIAERIELVKQADGTWEETKREFNGENIRLWEQKFAKAAGSAPAQST